MPSSVQRRHVGQQLGAHRPVQRQRAHLAGADIADRASHRAEIDLGAAGHQVGHALRHLAVGHVLHLGAGDVHEQHGRQMRRRADADRVVVQFARIGLGVVDHLLHRFVRRHGRDLEHLLGGRHQHDRLEARDRIERRGRRQRHVDGERLRAEVQRVAVGRGRRAAAAPMLPLPPGRFSTMTLLAPHLAELVGDEAPEDVDGAGGRERDHDRRTGRVG